MNIENTSILIPTRNRPKILGRTLTELKERGFDNFPLLVYDDASDNSDEIANIVAQWPGARLLRGTRRGGQACGRNRLLEAASTTLALMLDDDSWPEEKDTFINAAKAMIEDDIGVATFQYRSLADGKLSIPRDERRRRVHSFLGGASVFHVPSILGIGGYREAFVYGYEEPEMSMRLWLANIRIEQFPDVVVSHNHFETPDENRDYREYDRLYARNGILMSSLNMPLLLGLPHGLLRSIRRSFYQRRSFDAKLKGTIQGIIDTFCMWSTRKPCTFSQAVRWIRQR
jgi:glycosyltransferase involved in cell wall biosynthesis